MCEAYLFPQPCWEVHTQDQSTGTLNGASFISGATLRWSLLHLNLQGTKGEQNREETGWHTNPDAQFDVFPAVDVHAWVEQAELAKVVAVDHEGAANHGGSPDKRKTQERICKDLSA